MLGTTRLPPLLAVLAVLAALSGCGSDEISGEIPQENADQLNNKLNEVRSAFELRDCDAASERTQEFGQLVDDLPATAGVELKGALRDAGDNLTLLLEQQCPVSGGTGEETVQPPTTTTDPTETTPTTNETEPTTETTGITTTTTTDEEPPPGNGNGGGPPGGDPPGGGPPGGGTDGGTGGTGGGNTGDETGD
jgi:hypothetical protein